ncbi:branched-chain amino acid ABC transporter substrate-binding protein [Pandoraea bronchicola]|uniref:Branched-chain amino acid ABC transporter substrate-binding protein n=1 Tax=Pandoraea bronchicola TaxID=2508287 RepID=A0A5E5BY24_9BURK|nr:branched-chain amino acid ABC transporter substrate-binding protein [Pandoraea bronchicola]VVE90709.1 branched-chain amino acid ABC transporter substrate-binding protein [Pandoraea bronchicola]
MLQKTLAASALILLASIPAHAAKVVTIGFAGSLTGSQAHLGKEIEQGIRLALEEINAQHPKIRGETIEFRLDAQDDAADPRLATTVAQRFIDNGVIAVIGHESSSASIATARLYAAAGIAEITPSATNPEFTRLGYRTAFRMVPNDNFLGKAIATYTTTTLKARRIAVLDDRSAYGQGIADVFADSVRNSGATIVSREYTNDKAVDFKPQLTRIKRSQPDAVFFGGMDAQAGMVLKQLKQLSIDTPFAGGDGICTGTLPQLAGSSFIDNVVCADAGLSLNAMPGGVTFAKRFQSRFGEPVKLYAPYAYDTTMAIYRAVLDAQSVDAARIVDALHRISFAGVSGQISFDEHGDLRSPVATITRYQDSVKTPITIVRD